MPDYSTEIAELEAIVNGAAQSVSVDGTSTAQRLYVIGPHKNSGAGVSHFGKLLWFTDG